MDRKALVRAQRAEAHGASRSAATAGRLPPFWTYDADTTTDYTGERGDDYTTTETYTTQENGRSVTRTRTVTHTRWRPAAGRVSDHFDDVLIPAGGAMPRKIVDRLSRGI